MTVQPAERIETELSVLEALDFEARELCEHEGSSGTSDCADHASWYLVYRCCGIDALLCAEHAMRKRKSLEDHLRRAQEFGIRPRCGECKAMTASMDNFLFTPIKPSA